MNGVPNNPTDQRYERLERVGRGTYGVVWKARAVNSNNPNAPLFALKEISLDNRDEGIPSTAIREIALLKELTHQNIVTLFDVIHGDDLLTLVFEYVDYDLRKLIDARGGGLEANLVKSLLHQLLMSLTFCHNHKVMHRDLKPQNLLITRGNQLKLADFGLARAFGIPVRSYTHEVVTLWYRAPDVLLGSRRYSTAVDLWSVGCIFAEMVSGKALFPGRDDSDELLKIFKTLGTPSEVTWPEVRDLPDWRTGFPQYPGLSWARIGQELDPFQNVLVDVGLELLSVFLQYDPNKRVTASEALSMEYFDDMPLIQQS